MHQRDAEQRSDASGKYGKPFGRGSDTHLMFENRTEVNGWLGVNPQSFSKVNNGRVRIFDRNKYRYGTQRNAQNRSADVGTAKKYNAIMARKILQLR